jgi:HSP20 family molecular chaperone IbpA
MQSYTCSWVFALSLLPCVQGAQAQPWPSYPTGPIPSQYPGVAAPPAAPAAPAAQPSGMRVSRSADAKAYYIDVELSGIKPEAVKVTQDGRWMTVTIDRTSQESRQQNFDDGRGYSRSYSLSSGMASRRFSLPGDADVAAMQREDTENRVHITLPRRGR